MSEETPLLASTSTSNEEVTEHERIYERFSRPRKTLILSLVSMAGILPCEYATHRCPTLANRWPHPVFVSGSFVPSIPQIAKDLDTTGSIVRYAFISPNVWLLL